MSSEKLNTPDYLAIERTNLANERTLLAYFRTFVLLLSSGIAIIKLDFLSDINMLGIALLILSPFVLIIGIIRFIGMKKRIMKHYQGVE